MNTLGAIQMPMGGMCWMCILGGIVGIGLLILIIIAIVRLVKK